MIADYQLLHRLNAVAGWVGLGNCREARAELDGVPQEAQSRVEVLKMRWIVDVTEQDWGKALATAQRMVDLYPDNPGGWLNQAYAVRRVAGGGLEAAWERLRPALHKFPKEPVIPYNLACYACQLGQLAQARELLQEAVRRSQGERIKSMALADSDLEPLWGEIRSW